ncbi:ubiquinol-cytochrome c reductase cytochrome c1 subunit [Rhodobacter sp. JA431]|uniref:cytochrome c1 n=1 Tax=Rhodobacter sp. JA431 TaxID=570013 RepID=UPI000BD2CED4|nr:cytochrome c1 [Rhodobacter sp. JA431]SOB91795.1 ubiquinol-cytochrome c reductase cytochrome c1 subunit [Rhodobacter sp. JA431]
MKKLLISAASALMLSAGGAMAVDHNVPDVAFSFEGPFGTYDVDQLRRGFQVYSEVCSACHGMKFVPIRTLADDGGPQLDPAFVREYAAGLDGVLDPETDEERDRKESDMFPERVGDGMGPDLSVMAKARAGFMGPNGLGLNQLFKGMGGPEYLYNYIIGFEENPECAPDGIDGYYYNHTFQVGGVPDSCKDANGVKITHGSWAQMPPPLVEDQVEYDDGTPATIEQMAYDVSAFLMWAAEPKMMARKQMGFVAVLLLGLMTVLLYLTNKRLWAPYKGKRH